MDRVKDWKDREILTHTDLNAEFSSITDHVETDADVTDATNVNAAGALMNSDYNANTFMYATTDDTPVVKTRAETIALLSGQADADFAMNAHKLTGLSVPSAAGHSVRATASITETALETGITNDATLTKATAVITDHRLVRGDGGSRNVQETTIVVDDSGRMVNASQPAFSAVLTATQTDVTGDATAYDITGAIWTEKYDQGGNFTNGTFTTPVTGKYLFTGAFAIAQLAAAHTHLGAQLVTSNNSYFAMYLDPHLIYSSGILMQNFAFYADMDLNDTAFLQITVNNGTKVVDMLGLYTWFQGALIC